MWPAARRRWVSARKWEAGQHLSGEPEPGWMTMVRPVVVRRRRPLSEMERIIWRRDSRTAGRVDSWDISWSVAC